MPTLNILDEELPDGPMVLVVDDEELIRSLLSKTLGASGFIALTTPTAETALEIISNFHDRLTAVITDIHLEPGTMDGISLCRRVREFSPELEILAISGAFTDQMLDDLDSLGVRTLTKPFKISDLLTILRTMEDALPSRLISSPVPLPLPSPI